MPVPRFDRTLVKLIAREAGVPEDAVWVTKTKGHGAEDKTRVFFWTSKMDRKQFERLASTGAANFRGRHGGGMSRRHKVAAFLESFNAEGWLTKVDPREAQPHDLYSLKPREWCECGTKLMTPQEKFVGKCEGCSPMPKFKSG